MSMKITFLIYVYVYMGVLHAVVHIWGSEDSLEELVISFHHEDSGNRT